MITQAQTDTVKALLAGREHVVIFTHLSPDGDAMGSALGLKHWLQSCGYVDVRVVVPNPFPDFLSWLPGAQEIIIYSNAKEEAERAAREADLLFCLDFNEPKRIGDAAALFDLVSCPKVLIDHHLYPDEQMVDAILSYPNAPATCYLVLELINNLQIQQPTNGSLSTDTATCLYCGLMTDTGNFAFNSNNPVLYEMIAQLLRAGINKDQIFDAVFNQYSSHRMELMGYCLFRKMRIFPKYHTALVTLSMSELRRFNYQKGDSEGFEIGRAHV